MRKHEQETAAGERRSGPAKPRPPLPTADAPPGCVWPAAPGRQLLREIPRGPVAWRDDLAGAHGVSDGSGTPDLLLARVGSWCFKTSCRRRFSGVDEARHGLLVLARKKAALGVLLPESTVLCVGLAAREPFLWTVSPWRVTFRSALNDAEEAGDEGAVAAALVRFALSAAAALRFTARTGHALDIHPSNFAGDPPCYLDDDIGAGVPEGTAGYALLRRVEEYARWPRAVERYRAALEDLVTHGLSPSELRRTSLAESIDSAPVRSPEGLAAKERLARVARRTASRAP